MKKIWLSSFLLFVILSASVYFVFDNGISKVRIDIQNTKTTYQVYENNSHFENVFNGGFV